MNSLGAAYRAVGRLDEALTLLEKSVELSKTRHGEQAPRTLSSMHNLASGYLTAGRISDAISLYDETVRCRRTL